MLQHWNFFIGQYDYEKIFRENIYYLNMLINLDFKCNLRVCTLQVLNFLILNFI